jgi:hypothetical protein
MPFSRKEEVKFQNIIEKAMQELQETPTIPGGIPTLLDIPNRKPLPIRAGGNRSLLEDIVEFNPQTYEAYINHLKRGSYFSNAAEAVGLNSLTVKGWGTRGKEDYYAEKDTFYARFYQDVRRAVAQCRTAVEQAMVTINPQKWLARGPGRIFGEQWAENPTVEVQTPTEEETLFIEQPEVQQIEHSGVETTVIVLDTQTEQETLDILQETLRIRKEE